MVEQTIEHVIPPIEPGTEWTNKVEKCAKCGKTQICGYALKVAGKWKPYCGGCIKPEIEADVKQVKKK